MGGWVGGLLPEPTSQASRQVCKARVETVLGLELVTRRGGGGDCFLGGWVGGWVDGKGEENEAV